MVASETELAFSLALNIRMFFRTLKRHVHEQGGQSGLSAAQISVVLRLEKDGLATVSSLARAEGMRPQSMSAVMAPLQPSTIMSTNASMRPKPMGPCPLNRERSRFGEDHQADVVQAVSRKKVFVRWSAIHTARAGETL